MAIKYTAGDEVVLMHSSHDVYQLQDGIFLFYDRDSGYGKIKTSTGTQVYNLAFVFPARVKAELIKILIQRAKLKREFDDSMSLIYHLINAISRGEA
jgi:hypothetical protein